MRSSAFTLGGYALSQGLRFASNLILTRLLFPEAFGIMALVAVVIQGLAMFSDVGITPAILQSKRGDDQRFLDTAWTIQVIRGALLWLIACALAVPIATIYQAPLLMWILPVAGFSLLIGGFNPTRLDSANRHLMLGRITSIEIVVQIVTLVVAGVLAWAFNSVWALVFAWVLSAGLLLAAYNIWLPGTRNRFFFERAAAQELIRFGKWIFLSTICGFLYLQGDKLILGKFLTLESFGIYNIGFFLASFPLLMGSVMTRKTLIPLYRERPPAHSRENFRSLQRMRFVLTAGMMAVSGGLSMIGAPLVDILYDPRYAMAGGVVVMIAAMQLPQILVLTYEQAALASGDSRRFFVLSLARAALMLAFLFLGLTWGGLFGALIGQGLAGLAVYPFVVWLARQSGAWDLKHDAIYALIGAGLIAATFYINFEVIVALALI